MNKASEKVSSTEAEMIEEDDKEYEKLLFKANMWEDSAQKMKAQEDINRNELQKMKDYLPEF